MSANILVLDLETVPLASSLAMPYPDGERFPPSNYSKPEAIASWREKDRATWTEQRIKECSLSPRLGRIAVLGYASNDGPATTIVAEHEAGERALLHHLWSLFTPDVRVVTFNGTAFDCRFLAVRSAIQGIDPGNYAHVQNWFRRYSLWPHFDVRAVLTGWDDRQSGKLGEWCESFGIAHDDTTTGADVHRLAQAGEWDAIAAHCRSDVEQTRALFYRVAPLFTSDVLSLAESAA